MGCFGQHHFVITVIGNLTKTTDALSDVCLSSSGMPGADKKVSVKITLTEALATLAVGAAVQKILELSVQLWIRLHLPFYSVPPTVRTGASLSDPWQDTTSAEAVSAGKGTTGWSNTLKTNGTIKLHGCTLCVEG